MREKPKKYEEHLSAAFAFDEDDLAANQAGQLSRRQISHLMAAQRSALYGWAALALVDLIGLAIVAPALGSLGGLSPAALIVPLVIAGILAAACLVGMTSARRLSADVRANRVAEVEGRIDLATSASQNIVRYFLRVDKLRFPLKKPMFFALKNGDPYRIYYAPRSKKILSVVWLRENDDNLRDEDEIRADSSPDQGSEPTQIQRQRRRP